MKLNCFVSTLFSASFGSPMLFVVSKCEVIGKVTWLTLITVFAVTAVLSTVTVVVYALLVLRVAVVVIDVVTAVLIWINSSAISSLYSINTKVLLANSISQVTQASNIH